MTIKSNNNKILKTMNKIKKNSILNSSNFNDIKKEIIIKENIFLFKYFLDQIFKKDIPIKNIKIFLTIFIIDKNDDLFLKKEDQEIELKNSSINLKNDFNNILEEKSIKNINNINNFEKKFNNYIYIYNKWDINNKVLLLNIYYNSYQQINIDIKDLENTTVENKNIILENYKEQRNNIEKNIKLITTNQEFNNFLNGIITKKVNNFDVQIINNLKLAYKDILRTQLNINNNEFYFIIKILKEIVNYFKIYYKNDINKIIAIEKNINIDLLKQNFKKKNKIKILLNYLIFIFSLYDSKFIDNIKSLNNYYDNFDNFINKLNYENIIIDNIIKIYENINY